MHVLIISIDPHADQKQSSVAQRLRTYAQKVKQLSIITYTPRGHHPVSLAHNAKVYPTNSPHKSLFITHALRIATAIHKKKPIDLIVTQDALFTGLIGSLLKKKLHSALQIQLHGDYFHNKWAYVTPLVRLMQYPMTRFIKSADSIRVVSSRIEKKIKHINPNTITIPIYTDLKKFKTAHKTKLSGNPRFLFVGRLEQEKNVRFLLHTFALFKATHPKATLHLVGDGTEKKRLVRLTHKLNLTNNTHFVGKTDPAPYYKSATALIIPSLYEGWGLVAIEAAAAGCPVIMSDVGCAGEIIIHNKSGLVFPINNTTRLLNYMHKMTNKTLAKKLSSEATKRVQLLPTENQTLQKLVHSWKTATKNRSHLQR